LRDKTGFLGDGLLVNIDSPVGLTCGNAQQLVLPDGTFLEIGTIPDDQGSPNPGPGDVGIETTLVQGPGS
jgi:hypothetical protein